MTTDLEAMMAGVRTVLKLKTKMIERGMTRARTTCPMCGKPNLWAVLAKNSRSKHGHIHAKCQTPECTMMMME
jgi:hypothetical protein